MEGIVLKGIGGFYYVDTGNKIYECRARGALRKQNITPLVGDKVILKSVDEVNGTGMLYDVLPRTNALVRPAVANVTQLIAVISAINPEPNLLLLDKLIASSENMGIRIIICVNKTDIERGEKYINIYKKAGFDTIELSAKEGSNIDILKNYLNNNISVFAGNSGVGKSSLINLLLGEKVFETGEISQKICRGKHTTRHSEIKKLPSGGYIIDTPGFGSLEMYGRESEETDSLFREFSEFKNECRYKDCRHIKEDGCGVISALNRGDISFSRYESYKSIFEEVQSKIKNLYN